MSFFSNLKTLLTPPRTTTDSEPPATKISKKNTDQLTPEQQIKQSVEVDLERFEQITENCFHQELLSSLSAQLIELRQQRLHSSLTKRLWKSLFARETAPIETLIETPYSKHWAAELKTKWLTPLRQLDSWFTFGRYKAFSGEIEQLMTDYQTLWAGETMVSCLPQTFFDKLAQFDRIEKGTLEASVINAFHRYFFSTLSTSINHLTNHHAAVTTKPSHDPLENAQWEEDLQSHWYGPLDTKGEGTLRIQLEWLMVKYQTIWSDVTQQEHLLGDFQSKLHRLIEKINEQKRLPPISDTDLLSNVDKIITDFQTITQTITTPPPANATATTEDKIIADAPEPSTLNQYFTANGRQDHHHLLLQLNLAKQAYQQTKTPLNKRRFLQHFEDKLNTLRKKTQSPPSTEGIGQQLIRGAKWIFSCIKSLFFGRAPEIELTSLHDTIEQTITTYQEATNDIKSHLSQDLKQYHQTLSTQTQQDQQILATHVNFSFGEHTIDCSGVTSNVRDYFSQHGIDTAIGRLDEKFLQKPTLEETQHNVHKSAAGKKITSQFLQNRSFDVRGGEAEQAERLMIVEAGITQAKTQGIIDYELSTADGLCTLDNIEFKQQPECKTPERQSEEKITENEPHSQQLYSNYLEQINSAASGSMQALDETSEQVRAIFKHNNISENTKLSLLLLLTYIAEGGKKETAHILLTTFMSKRSTGYLVQLDDLEKAHSYDRNARFFKASKPDRFLALLKKLISLETKDKENTLNKSIPQLLINDIETLITPDTKKPHTSPIKSMKMKPPSQLRQRTCHTQERLSSETPRI